MSRPTKRFAALLVAGVALAPTLAGCGQSDPTKAPSQGAGTTPTTPEPAATVAALPEAIDYNDPKELAAALQSLGVETPAYERAGTERSVVTGVAFPTWPTGEVRKAGLSTFRVDVNTSYDGKGALKFFEGKRELYSTPFSPTGTRTVQKIPAVVLESLKTGDKVTWGVYFENKRQKPITVDFTVTEKAPATKKVAELEAKKGLSDLGRMIAKAQVLKNYSFLSEALVAYVGVVEADESVTSVYADIVDCLRRLKLKNTPLFEHAQLRMTSTVSPARKAFAGGISGGSIASGGPSSGDIPSGLPGGMAPIGPTKVGKTGTGSGKSGLQQGGTGIPPPPSSTTPGATPGGDPAADAASGGKSLEQLMATARALKEAASQARNRANFASDAAAEAKKAADKAQLEADGKKAMAVGLQAKADEARAKAADPTLTPEQKQAFLEEAGNYDAQAAEWRAKAEEAAAVAGEKRLHADTLAKDAERLSREADALEQNANSMPVLPGTGPTSDPMAPAPLSELSHAQKVAMAQKLVQAAQANVAAAEQRVKDAKQGVHAAMGGSPAEKLAAAKELEAAKAGLEAATEAANQAHEALGALQQGP